jgi:hypothetical protein
MASGTDSGTYKRAVLQLEMVCMKVWTGCQQHCRSESKAHCKVLGTLMHTHTHIAHCTIPAALVHYSSQQFAVAAAAASATV